MTIKKRISGKDVFQALVFVGGLDPAYVLDDMEPYEIDACMEGIHKKYIESWNQTRQLVYTIAQVNSSKRIDIKDMMPFPWDENDSMEMPEEERERLSYMLNEFVKLKNNGGGSIRKNPVQE